MTKKKSSNNYSTFHDIEAPLLRTWNRAHTAITISQDISIDEAGKYVEQFSKKDREAINMMFSNIVKNGSKAVRDSVMKEIENA